MSEKLYRYNHMTMDTLIITMDSHDRKVSIEVGSDIDIYELMELIAGMLTTSGYHYNSIINGMHYYVEGHSNDNAGNLDS